MIISFLGDSITEGVGATSRENRFSSVLCRKVGAIEENYGLSGTRIARQRVHYGDVPDEDFIIRTRWMDPKADFVFVFGGTNDFGHGDAPIGQKGDDTPFTFYGAMKQLCDILLEKFGEEKVCFLLPTPRYSQDFPNNNGVKTWGNFPALEGYREVMRDVLSSYHFDTLELSALPDHPKQGSSEFYKDGLHPNDKGHEAIADELYRYLQKKGLAH